jgi:outer membrane protein OmpA-like peptidoglycan-associated protein
MSRALASAAVVLAAAGLLSGCLTPKARPAPSGAVLEARKGVGQKPPSCKSQALADVSPALASFPFDDSLLDEEGARRVSQAADWLACHPGTPVVVLPSADSHGTPEHQKDLAGRRAQAVMAALRADGANQAVVHMLAMGAADPVAGPHVVIRAAGRGW